MLALAAFVLCQSCFILVPSAFCQDTPAGPGNLRAGAATSNITPPIGGGIVGGFVPVPSTHIHDELHARCLVLDDGKTRLALVVCDLLGIHRSVSDRARELIFTKTGISKDCVLISATHTHSATSALGDRRYSFDSELNEYQQFVAERIADGVVRAINQLEPAEVAFGSASVPEHVFNRRWFMTEEKIPDTPFGTRDRVKMNPPAGSPDLIDPAGPTDPAVSFIALRRHNGQLISLYAAYSLHYVGGTGPGHISADYFGMFCQELIRLTDSSDADPPFVPMMANGTSGDINNINFRTPRPGQPPYAQMKYVANDVASKVHLALEGIDWSGSTQLDASYREVDVRWRRPTPAQLEWAKSKLAEPASDTNKTDLPRIYAERTLAMAGQPETAPVPVQVLKIGNARVGSLPCEVLVEIGLAFRKQSHSKPAFLVSMAHGYYGYLPTPEQHELGGYETWLGTNRLEIDSSVVLLNALVQMSGDEQR
ncbi:MAG: neutral/alkaline non-lysosomal ceramidase N-terminal domain-containing protein [Planctomyces sp.]|nr:neutral/alkaline non-lysosomal ceramidase N-terminal domain-containing protein [Planctomyces sp.]